MSKLAAVASPVFLIAVLLTGMTDASADVVRSHALIRSILIQGVNLSMTPRQAFETLIKRGYSAGGINSFEDWRSGSIQMVRGGPDDPRGESFVALGRKSGQLINISEDTNKRSGERIDYQAEIADLRQHLGIPEGESSCIANNDKGAGLCSVSDGNSQRPFAFLYQVRAISRSANLGYVFEPTVGLDDEQ